MKLHVSLDYTIPEGDLKPYFDALQRGEALASKCQACMHVAFPARALCGACGAAQMDWAALAGDACVVHRTGSAHACFALVQFSGADSLTVVALTNPESLAETGRLSPPAHDRPGLYLTLEEKPKGDTDV